MDPNQPQNQPPEDDDELETLGEPDDTDLDEPLEDEEDEVDDVDEIQEPLDEDDDAVVDEVNNTGEANAFEDDDTESPLP